MAPSYKNLKLSTLGAFIASFLIISPHFDLAHATTAATYTDNTTQRSSTIENVTSDLIKIELYVSSSTRNLIDNDAIEGGNLTLVLEVTALKCVAPKLNFSGEELVIHSHKKNGSTFKLGSEVTSRSDLNESLAAEITSFRVPEDVVTFSCSVQANESSIQRQGIWINITVLDLPSELTVTSSENQNMTVNLTSGAEVNLYCQLPGPTQENTRLWDDLLKTNSSYNSKKEYESNSTFEFIRFYQIAGEHLTCTENLTEKTDGEEHHFIFNITIHTPAPTEKLTDIAETTATTSNPPKSTGENTTLTTTTKTESPRSSKESTNLTSVSTSTTTETTTTKSTLLSSTIKPEEEEKSNSKPISTAWTVFLAIFFTICFLSAFVFILWKKRTPGGSIVLCGRILRPRARRETEEYGMLL